MKRCSQTTKSGKQCKAASMNGTTRCLFHTVRKTKATTRGRMAKYGRKMRK